MPLTRTPTKPLVAAPERSLDQRMEALKRANKIRTARSQLKRDLKAGRRSIHDVVLEPPDYLETAKVFDVLLAVPKYGRVKVNKVLQLCRVSPSKTLGGLSQRQRSEIVSMLRRNPPAPRAIPAPLRPVQRLTDSSPRLKPPPAVSAFQRRVLRLVVIDYSAITGANLYAAATALQSNPSAVAFACNDLKRAGLMDEAGAATPMGRDTAAMVPA